MKKRGIFLLLILSTFASASFADDEQELRHIKTVLWPQAYLTQDVQLLDSLLHDSFEVVSDTGERSSKQDELDYISNNTWDPGNFKYRIDRLEIYDSSFAIVSGTGMADAYTYTSSNALIKEDGKWRAVSSHVSGVKGTDEQKQGEWLSSIKKSWDEEDLSFKTSPTSPLAGTQRFEIDENKTVFLADLDGQPVLSLEQSDMPVFELTRNEDQWTWTGRGEEINLTRADENMPSGTFLAAGDRLKAGRLTVQFYPSREKVIVLVFDPKTERLDAFKTLDRFEPNPKFAITARIARFEDPEQLEMITARQQFKKQYRYARLHFEIDGTPLELTAYKHALEGDGSKLLFIPFSDKTSGKLTYGGGRYLFAEEPAEGDEVPIDFNLVINPLCSYATIYNCIVPTLENKLQIEVLAGVKNYDHPDH